MIYASLSVLNKTYFCTNSKGKTSDTFIFRPNKVYLHTKMIIQNQKLSTFILETKYVYRSIKKDKRPYTFNLRPD